ncbi:MAG: lipopolysaccharide kinase InaA family protein [Planctomycetota bacterium]
MQTEVTLAPGIPDLAALGAAEPSDLLGTGAGLIGEARAQPLEAAPGSELLRCPLPGTPDENGRVHESPRGAGTGWILVQRFSRASLGQLLRARLRAPRSDSLATREWNLLCRLRQAGVSTPEPLALVRQRHPFFARRSALVTRELEGLTRAPDWFASERDAARRRLAVRSLGLMLSQLLSSGIELPNLCPADLWLADASVSGPAERRGMGPGLTWRALPEVFLCSVHGGRLRRASRPRVGHVSSFLSRLGASPEARALASRERLRLLLLAARCLLPGIRRRRLVLALARL